MLNLLVYDVTSRLEKVDVSFKEIYHHHHVSVMELGHLLTRSGLTYPKSLQRSAMIPSAGWGIALK
jgi:hypothetical protein